MEDKDNAPIDYASLPPELVEKIKGWEKKKADNDPVARQLQLLTDIADISQELLGVSDKNKDTLAKSLPALGAVLTDAREQLIKLNSETSKAMVAATEKLSKAITTSMKGLDVAPVFKPEFKPEFKPNIKVESPDVHVPAPQVTVDMKEIQKILKTDVPKAFKEAISKIPKTDFPEMPDRWDEVLEWLQSIDTASRMKPQFPTAQFNEMNTSLSDIKDSLDTSGAYFQFDADDSAPTYIGIHVDPDADDDNTDWKIFKFTYSGDNVTSIRKKTGVWSHRTSLF